MGAYDDFLHIGIALGIGLLIGLERGWHERDVPEGGRVAGFRTIALIGLTGGLLGILSLKVGVMAMAAGFIAVAVLLALGYRKTLEHDTDLSVTTFIAAMLALILGALAGIGQPRLAVMSAVAVALLLHFKPGIHRFLQKLEAVELYATIRFCLISGVILPLLPNQGFGPYEALNPYIIWWMVVLVSGLSFAGYIAVRVLGSHKGVLVTAAIGSLVSSTAIALTFSREAKMQSQATSILAAGIIMASTIMNIRMLFIATLIVPGFFPTLAYMLLPMFLAGLISSFVLAKHAKPASEPALILQNPFDLRIALFFGVVLAAVLLGIHFLEARYGSSGLYSLSIVTGLMDVDAMTISVSQLVGKELDTWPAAVAIAFSAIANSVAKAVLCVVVGGRAVAKPAIFAFSTMIFTGFAVIILAQEIVGGLF